MALSKADRGYPGDYRDQRPFFGERMIPLSSLPNAYQVYQSNAVQTAPPAKLVLMLYEGALRFLARAGEAVAGRDVETVHENLVKAQAIVAELMANVNREAGEVGEQLFLLYDYMYNRLVEANVKKDAALIDEVRDMLTELRDAWTRAMQAAGQGVRAG